MSQPPNYNAYPPQLGQRREPGLILLFAFLTCGIYYLYFIYKASEEMRNFMQEPDTDPSMEVLLSVITCGLYTVYWDYKTAQKVAWMQRRVGIMPTDNAILFLILNVVQLGFVPSMIIQGHLNDIWYRAEHNYSQSGSYYVA